MLLINAASPTYQLIGFADADEKLHYTRINGLQVIGGRRKVKELSSQRQIAVVMAIANTTVKQTIVAELADSVNWGTLVHPRAMVSASARVGIGNILQAHVIVAANVSDRAGSTLRGLARERKTGRNGDHYERCTLTMVTNLTEGATR